MLIEFAPLVFGIPALLAVFLFSRFLSTEQNDHPKVVVA